MPIIPHTNTAWMSGLQPRAWWYPATLEQLKVCSAVVMVEGWEDSTGAIEELKEATRMGLLIFMSTEKIPDVNPRTPGKDTDD